VAEPVAGPTKVAHPGATGALMAGVREPGCAEAHPHERTLRRLASEYAPAGEISTTECERRVGPAVGKERLPNDDGGMAPQLDPTLLALTERDPEPDYSPGSNNWVLSGAHTRSGKPLLSNDPHLGHTIPSIWYQLELEAPGFHVAGVTFPGGPLVVIGHNERIAWGMTNTGPDVQDIYLETFKPDDPNKYLVNGKWVDAAVRQERINVRRARDVTLTVRSTRHGPVIGMDGKYAMALKWTVLQPHAFTFPFLKIDQAQNWQEFTEALRYFISPEQNMVYADADGNIGYYAPAWVPIRKHGDGSVPVRGDIGDDEWTGYVPFQDLPHSYNPPEGIIATANSRVVPEGYPYFITHTWAAPWRTARIFRLLEAGTNFTVEDMLRIDMDVYSLEDVELTRNLLIAGALRPPERPELKLALSLLREWDGNAYADSRATLICEITRAVLLERLLRPKLGDDATHYHWSLGSTFVNDAIHNNWTRWLPPGDADFNVTLMRSLEQALSRISKLVGSDKPFDWKWGTTIPLTFRHPLDAFPLGTRILDVGPFPQMGMATTVKATTATSGPSMRLVIDFGNLDDSVNNITLGESGQVFSPYYGDQFSAWYTGRSFPMLFSDAAVISGAVHKLVLEPAK
jgi:penicillin G amidase